MTVRPYQPQDRPQLEALAKASGYPYPDPQGPLIESLYVVLGDDDRIVMACAAERMVQCYLWTSTQLHPAAMVGYIRALHQQMMPVLKQKGYDGADAYIPPVIAARFGRRLEKSFGWVRNWASWCFKFHP